MVDPVFQVLSRILDMNSGQKTGGFDQQFTHTIELFFLQFSQGHSNFFFKLMAILIICVTSKNGFHMSYIFGTLFSGTPSIFVFFTYQKH